MSGTEKEFIFSVNPGKSLFLKDTLYADYRDVFRTPSNI